VDIEATKSAQDRRWEGVVSLSAMVAEDSVEDRVGRGRIGVGASSSGVPSVKSAKDGVGATPVAMVADGGDGGWGWAVVGVVSSGSGASSSRRSAAKCGK